ncbi:MAG: 4-hydroxybenzoate octaprenyltransferase [Hyphomicrobiaceae bacterium]
MTARTPAGGSQRVADAPVANWVDSYAPAAWKPYLKLMRADRPIGIWLLLFPCWWSQLLAHLALGQAWIDVWFLALFALGATVMRGAGCTWNDIVDRDYDGRVQRTALRPIPAGQVTAKQALVLAVALSLVGFVVLIQFNWATIAIGIASLALVAAYPFAKRYTYWPQLVLGLTFNWGALVGWAAVTGSVSLAPLALYAGAVLWTLAYDTIYAHQDAEDDAVLGLKSTALRFGSSTPQWLWAFYGGAILLWLVAAVAAGAQFALFVAIAVSAGHFAWQIVTLEIGNAANCLERFRSNRFIGWFLAIGLAAEILLVRF